MLEVWSKNFQKSFKWLNTLVLMFSDDVLKNIYIRIYILLRSWNIEYWRQSDKILEYFQWIRFSQNNLTSKSKILKASWERYWNGKKKFKRKQDFLSGMMIICKQKISRHNKNLLGNSSIMRIQKASTRNINSKNNQLFQKKLTCGKKI